MKEKIPNKHTRNHYLHRKEKGKKKQTEREGTSNHKEVNGWVMQ